MSDETPDSEPPSEGDSAGDSDAGRMVIAERYEVQRKLARGGMAAAVGLLVLMHPVYFSPGQVIIYGGTHSFGLMPDNNVDPGGLQCICTAQHIFEQRLPRQGMQHLG